MTIYFSYILIEYFGNLLPCSKAAVKIPPNPYSHPSYPKKFQSKPQNPSPNFWK